MTALSVLLPLALLCIGAMAFDIRLHRVPNLFNLGFFACGLGLSVARAGTLGLRDSLAGSAVCVAFLLLPFFLHMVGGGDVKFLAAAGAIVGLDLAWPGFLAGAAAGGVIALIVMLYQTRSLDGIKRTLLLLRHGSWLASAPSAQENAVAIPYTVPLSAGLIVVTALHFLRGAPGA